MNRILEFLRSTPFKGKIVTNQDFIADISWFILFAESSNGLVLRNWQINCDSCLIGGGAYSLSHYFMENYPIALIERKNFISHNLKRLTL